MTKRPLRIFLKKIIICLGLLIFYTAGCSHEETKTTVQTLDSIPTGATGLILNLTLSPQGNILPSDECRLNLRQMSDPQDYPVELHKGSQNIFTALPPGSYNFYDLYCGKGRTWDFSTKKWAPLQVVKGKISVSAPIEFRISSNVGMTTFFSNRNAVQKTLRDFFGQLSQQTKSNLVSAYNLKPVNDKMISQTQYQISVKLPAKHVKEGEPDQANYPEFKSCYSDEFALNPLYVGFVTIQATFIKKALVKTDVQSSQSAYTDQFHACIQNKLKEFVPNRSDELVYDIVL